MNAPRKMRCFPATMTTILLCFATQASAQQPQNVSTAVDFIKQICVYESKSERLSVSGAGTGEVSFRKLSAGGELRGEVKLDKSNVQGLVLGINNEISALSAEQANKMRDCGQPFLKQIVDILLSSH
jgi:hypothetical protein